MYPGPSLRINTRVPSHNAYASASIYDTPNIDADSERTPTLPPHSPIRYTPTVRHPYPFDISFSRDPARIRAVFDSHVAQARQCRNRNDSSSGQARASGCSENVTTPTQRSSVFPSSCPSSLSVATTSICQPTPSSLFPQTSSSSEMSSTIPKPNPSKQLAASLNLTVDIQRAKKLHWRSIQARQPVVLTPNTPPPASPRRPVTEYPSAETLYLINMYNAQAIQNNTEARWWSMCAKRERMIANWEREQAMMREDELEDEVSDASHSSSGETDDDEEMTIEEGEIIEIHDGDRRHERGPIQVCFEFNDDDEEWDRGRDRHHKRL